MTLNLHILRTALFAVLMGLFLTGPLTAQTAPPVPVTGPLPESAFAGHLMAYRDASRQSVIQDVRTLEQSGGFDRVAGFAPNFGYTKDVIWLRLGLHNTGTGTAADTEEWYLQLRENFFQLFEVYRVDPDGTVTVLEQQDATSPFSARKVRYPELVVALTLPPGQQTTLFLRYWSGGSSEVSMALHSRDSFGNFSTRRTAKNFVYYGAMLVLTIASLIAWAITRQFVFFAYGCNTMSALLFIMHGDGNAFQYLWPNAPGFNAYASILLGAGIILAAVNFARHFLQTYVFHPVMEKVLLAVLALTIALVVSSAVIDHQIIKKYLVLYATFAITVVVLSGLVAARTRFREVRFYVLAWTGAVVSSGLMTARHWLGIEISEDVQFDSMRIVLVLDAAFMGLAILDRINQLKRARETAMEQSLAEARRNLDLSNRLTELERDYALALQLGLSRERHMADTIHDLRQPLSALQMNVRTVVTGHAPDAGTIDQIEDAFGYLEGLIGQELQAHRHDPPVPITNQTADMAALLPRIHQMFAADAQAAGIDLRFVASTARLPLSPLNAMRLASNLVANAIKHSNGHKVLFGLRHSNGTLRFEVHDTGPGLDAADFEEATGRSVRLNPENTQDGAGLGLAIVRDIAESHDAKLSLLPRPGGGTSVCVTFREEIRK